jgi:hypothetical protein
MIVVYRIVIDLSPALSRGEGGVEPTPMSVCY